MAREPDKGIPLNLFDDAKCVIIIPAVKKGAPVPDVSTPDALKQTLLRAKSVTYMDPERGTSGTCLWKYRL